MDEFPVSDQPDLRIGAHLLAKLVEPSKWVNRRVTRLEFLNEQILRTHVSVDFELSKKPIEPGPGLPAAHLVPLALISKLSPGGLYNILTGFDLEDEEGRALPLLTSRCTSWLAWSALVAAAAGVLQVENGSKINDGLRELVEWEITAAIRDELPQLLEARGRTVFGPDWGKLRGDRAFARLWANLGGGFVLLVALPEDSARRRVLKYAYEEGVPKRPFVFRHDLPERIGWRPAPMSYFLTGVSDTVSYHLEVRIPDGLEWVDMSVELQRPPPARHEIKEAPSVGLRTAYVYVAGETETWGTQGLATLRARASRGNLLPGLVVSSLVALLLSAGAYFAGSIVPQGTTGVDPGALIAIVPTLIAALVASAPGEHPYTKRLLSGVRWQAALSGLLSFLAGGLLLVSSDTEAARRGLLVLAFLAWVLALVQVRSYFGPVATNLVGQALLLLVAGYAIFKLWGLKAALVALVWVAASSLLTFAVMESQRRKRAESQAEREKELVQREKDLQDQILSAKESAQTERVQAAQLQAQVDSAKEIRALLGKEVDFWRAKQQPTVGTEGKSTEGSASPS